MQMKQCVLKNIEAHKDAVTELEKTGIETIVSIAKAIINAIEQEGCIYLCGNGGSAADCQHIAGELVGRFRKERRALPAVAFSTDTSIITSIGNDYSFEDIFARQAEGLVQQNDILWAFSTSGASANIIKAAKVAKAKAAKVIAFTGKVDSELEKLSDLCLCAPTPYNSTAQEVHELAYHIICDLVEQYVVNKK